MNAINPDARVGEIVQKWPKTMRVFAHHNLDLCCGGAHSLEYAAKQHHLDLDKLIADLDEAIRGPLRETAGPDSMKAAEISDDE